MKYSIIIIAYKAFDLLDRCLDSIRASAIENYEIIIVDNTPGDRTPEETAIMEKADWVIHPMANLGFAKGCNVGAMQAKGETLIFLNPDTEVYGNWADRMHAHLDRKVPIKGQTIPTEDGPWGPIPYASQKVGAVGPISNFVAGGQNEIFHQGNANPADPMQTKLLIGFCLMMKKAVFDEVGAMDPDLFLGNDDLDLSWRLRLAGYTLLIAPDVFVYHAGHKSMETEKPEHIQKLLDESTAALKVKIQAHYGPACPSAVELWGVDFFQTRDKGPMKLSVVMIVREEEKNLAELLPQLGFADEVVLVDTNPLAPRGYIRNNMGRGAGPDHHWHHFPWVDDFAAARNFANSKATGDYILWLDADDRITPESAALIRQGMDNPSDRMLRKTCFFNLKLENTIDGKPNGETVYQPRIFPNLPEIQWKGAVHENIIESMTRLNLTPIPLASISITHTGYDTRELREAKANRNAAILRTMPDTPQKYWDLGNAYASCDQYEEAYGFYRLALDRWEKHLGRGFRDHMAYLVGKCLFNLKEFALALEWLTTSDKPDAVFMRALCLEAMGGAWKPVMEAYLTIPEAPDTYGTHRTFMHQEGRRMLNG